MYHYLFLRRLVVFIIVKRVIQIKLLPTAQQAGALEQTMRRFNTACNWVAERDFERQLVNSYALHKCPHGRRKQTGSKGDLCNRTDS